MTFADPVESLNPHSTALREWEPRAPAALKPVLIQAADALDDTQRKADDYAAAIALFRSFMHDWAARLDGSTDVRIGMMDSDSRAQEKVQAAQQTVLDVARLMREAAALS